MLLIVGAIILAIVMIVVSLSYVRESQTSLEAAEDRASKAEEEAREAERIAEEQRTQTARLKADYSNWVASVRRRCTSDAWPPRSVACGGTVRWSDVAFDDFSVVKSDGGVVTDGGRKKEERLSWALASMTLPTRPGIIGQSLSILETFSARTQRCP